MEIDEGMVRIGDELGVSMDEDLPRLHKAEVGYTANVEKILDNLTSPLEVTYTVEEKCFRIYLYGNLQYVRK